MQLDDPLNSMKPLEFSGFPLDGTDLYELFFNYSLLLKEKVYNIV